MNSCNYDSLCDEIEKVLIDDDEAMLKAKQRIINYVCNIDIRADWFLNKVDLINLIKRCLGRQLLIIWIISKSRMLN